MSHPQQQQQDQAPVQSSDDGYADVFAVIAIIAIVVSTAVFWLKSM